MEDFKIPVHPVEETNTETAVTPQCPFKIPPWSAPPPANQKYKFEVLKSGSIIDEIKELNSKATWTFGRLPQNDIEMAHPTISRFHCVLQYRPSQADVDAAADKPPEGWYIYDLDSTHGTFLNKQRVPANVFIRIRVGHMLRLGTSTRNFILHGPTEDEEPETELGVTELREKKKKEEQIAIAEIQERAQKAAPKQRTEGISWGMTEDADEETDLKHNPYASTTNEDLFLDDPKKTLRGYFEREGHILEYRCDEMSAGTFVCRVELPIDDENGRSLLAEVIHKGKKKDCVAQCALEACRILDRYGVLRQANQESKKRVIKKADSDSDDDYLDRTGDVARKKQRKSNSHVNQTLTYDDLVKKGADITEQIAEVDRKILDFQNKQEEQKRAAKAQQQSDDIDSYMETLCENSSKLDKTEIRKLRMQQQNLNAELQKTQKLIHLTKPAELPFLLETNVASSIETKPDIKKQLPMIGKRNQFSKFKVVKEVVKSVSNINLPLGSDEEEVEEESEKEEELKEKQEIVKNETKAEKFYGPAVIPKEILEQQTLVVKNAVIDTEINVEKKKVVQKECEMPAIVEQSHEAADKAVENNKKRHRQRHRKRQDQIEGEDESEEYGSSDKYAKWVPPQNQSGDGFTELNDKFGY